MKIKRFNDINENFNDNNTSLTKIKDVSIFSVFFQHIENYSDHTVNECTLQWSYTIDADMQGVDSIDTNIISVTLDVLIITYDDNDGDGEIEETLIFNNENSTINIHDTEFVKDVRSENGGYDKQVLPYYPLEVEVSKDKQGNTVVDIYFV